MKILFLGWEPFQGSSGLATYSRAIMQALGNHDDCQLLTYMPFSPLPTSQSRSGMLRNMQQVGTASTLGYGRTLRYKMRAVREVRRVDYDIVICAHLNLIPVARALHNESPHVLGIFVAYGDEVWSPPASGRGSLNMHGYKHLIGDSDTTVQRFRHWAEPGLQSCHVLPNCVDLYRYTPGPKDPILMARYGLRGKRVLMSLGRMTQAAPHNGYDRILDAMPKLLRREPNLIYLCAGGGDDRERLIAKAESLGIGQYVVFPGKISEIEKIQHYRLADCFAMPGTGKAFGVVYMEAMACGVPVVASAADGGLEAVMDGRLGKLVDPTDSTSVEEGIAQVLHDPSPPPRELLEPFSTQRFGERVHRIVHNIVATVPQDAALAMHAVQRRAAPLWRG